MKQFTLFLLLIFSGFLFNDCCLVAAERMPKEVPNTIDNTITPCDDLAATRKPDCNVDSESIKRPPKTLDENNGIIISPKKPLEPEVSAKPKLNKNDKPK